MKESNFQRILVKSLRECGAVVFNVHGHAYQIAGIPDLYVAHPIWNGWLELKTGNNPLTKLQTKTLKNLEAAKVRVFTLVEKKPRILVKDSDGTILSHIPFLINDLDGIDVLRNLEKVSEILNGKKE